jgi:hypothetical protein
MKKFRIKIVLCGMIVITAFSCKKETSVSSNNHLGEPFTIKANETKSLTSFISANSSSDSTLYLSFKKVISDGRCPKATCYLCYGSIASIQVFLAHQKDTATISLPILGCGTDDDNCYQPKDTLGYRICLLRLDPYPTGNAPINPSNYTAKLNVSKYKVSINQE